ncbi:hypothetical protein Clacol_000337 [Clathrus columnatus]|uniref:RRM domain-containing protein n=1 Tax=Clathrus columnatus TaxID=1419009 RepID=A0AAV5A0I4_9AGAM|nr:hypothetical protein Clacol_000337 [Clathrus columnatus]
MSSNLDKSLDQVIIASRKNGNKRRGARRSSVKAALLGSSPAKAPKAITKAKVADTKSNPPPTAEKIIVSNLPPDVNEAQIKELFNSQVGPTKEVVLNYDAAGRSKGIAAVTFTRNGDGTKAYKQYNGRLIDGSQYLSFPWISPSSLREIYVHS